MTQATATKRCPRCGEIQPLTGFSLDRSKASGRSSHCKACDNAKRRAAYYGGLDRPEPPPRPPRAIRRCEACSAEIVRQGKRFCSRSCANNRARHDFDRECLECGKSFRAGAVSQRRCSNECAIFGKTSARSCELAWVSCPCCRVIFRASRKTCGDVRCYYKLRYVRGAAKPCETCHTLMPSRQGRSHRWCSLECARLSPDHRETVAASRRRRRARKRNAASEPYQAVEIFERDQWRCHLCTKALKRNAIVPHPKAPTIDHLVPLASGGDDTRANVRAAHFICNSAKGHRGGGEQLMLVG